MSGKLLEIKKLEVSFMYNGSFLKVVRGIDINVDEGEIVGVLGESGSGKTVTATSVLGILKDDGGRIEAGEIIFDGKDLLKIKEKEIRKIRGNEIAYVFQNPVESLNPYKKIGKQIEETVKVHGREFSKENAIETMKDVGIDNAEIIYKMYPEQLSGGQAQRVIIAMSLINRPKLLIADEPTNAIDASLRKKVLELLKYINTRYGTSVVIITHDFDVVKHVCSRVVIMYGGLVMEEGNMKVILNSPLHPYTMELLKCVNSLNENEGPLYTLEGRSLNPTEFTGGCPFYNRCKVKTAQCMKAIPDLIKYEDNRSVRCINHEKLKKQN